MPIAFCWFGSYRWFPSIRRLQSSGRRQSSAGIARGWGIFAVSQSCWQAENLGRTAQAHWRDEPCKSPLGCAHTFMVNCSILFGTRTLPMARSSCGVARHGHSVQADCTPIAAAEPDSFRAGRESRRISLGPGLCPVGDSASSGPPSWGSAGKPSSFGCRG
jgi:hypothetical protein